MKKQSLFIFLLAAAVCFFIVYNIQLYQKRSVVLAAAEPREKGITKETDSATPVIEYKGKKYRRNTYLKAILFIGVDSAGTVEETKTPGLAGQADGLFLVAEDTARDRIKILMIPRDTMAEITLTDLEGNVIGKDLQHITLAYAYGDGKEKSCLYLKAAVSDLLGGLEIEHYLTVNTSAIGVLNNGIEGVPVSIYTDELEHMDSDLKKGTTVLIDGKQAEVFLRYRDVNVTNSALTRMERQKQYMKAYMKRLQMKCSQDSQLIVRLTEELQKYVLTDMDKNQYMGMAADILASGQLLTDQDIYAVPGEGIATELYDEYHPDKNALMELILKLFYREVR